MSEFNFEVAGGSTVRLKTAGKYCDRDIVVKSSNSDTSGDNKFKQLVDRTITEVVAEDLAGVTMLGVNAFYGCDKLKTLIIPEGITVIAQWAVRNCTSLTNITIPSSVVRIEGAYTFGNCRNLAEVNFRGKTTIEGNAFGMCDNLAIINVPWSEGEVANAPWGATNATINYNSEV